MNTKETCSKMMSYDTGLFLMRLALGLPFVVHGWDKINDMDKVVGFFGMLGIPSYMAWVVALVEFFGGLAVILGVNVKRAGWLLAIVMFFAILLVKNNADYMGGYELDLTLFLLASGLAFAGAGSYSWDAMTGKKGACGPCTDGVCSVHHK